MLLEIRLDGPIYGCARERSTSEDDHPPFGCRLKGRKRLLAWTQGTDLNEDARRLHHQRNPVGVPCKMRF